MSKVVRDVGSGLGFMEGTTERQLRRSLDRQLSEATGERKRKEEEQKELMTRMRRGTFGALGFGESGGMGVTALGSTP